MFILIGPNIYAHHHNSNIWATYDGAMGQNNIVSRKLFLHHHLALAPPEF
jgi:hypothetical protein